MTGDDDETLGLLVKFGEAINAAGFEGVVPFLHPEIEFHEPPEQPGAAIFRGLDAVRAGYAKWEENWLEQRSEPQGFEVLPDGRVLVFSRERMVGRDGLRVENDAGHIFTVQDGKVLRWQSFWDLANARAAAGL